MALRAGASSEPSRDRDALFGSGRATERLSSSAPKHTSPVDRGGQGQAGVRGQGGGLGYQGAGGGALEEPAARTRADHRSSRH